MRESEEMALHKKMQKIESEYEVKTESGKIVMTLDAVPNYAGGKGCPDEIITVKVRFPLLSTNIQLSIPILIEIEKAGYSAAMVDLDKFCERSILGEQKTYLEIPMIVIGGDSYRKLKSIERQLAARFSTTQVPKKSIQ